MVLLPAIVMLVVRLSKATSRITDTCQCHVSAVVQVIDSSRKAALEFHVAFHRAH